MKSLLVWLPMDEQIVSSAEHYQFVCHIVPHNMTEGQMIGFTDSKGSACCLIFAICSTFFSFLPAPMPDMLFLSQP